MKFGILGLVVVAQMAWGQDVQGFERIVRELSSEQYQGRGYAMDGVRKAGSYIEKEFREAGADEVTLQPFCIDINTFPGKMEMSVDGRKLAAGKEFSMREYSPGVSGEYSLYYIDTLNYDAEKIFADLARPENRGVFVVCDFWFRYDHKDDFQKLEESPEVSNKGMIYVWPTPLKFYKAYAEKVTPKPIIWVDSTFSKSAGKISFDIENQFFKDYESDNVIAKINGRRHDSCYVFTSHYDHLGNLGSGVYYPGANDNASGTAAIITFAAYYAQHQPEFDVYCIAFSGEDANLRGSNWFIEHPVMELNSIKYLFNLDMIADNNPVQYVEVSPQGEDGLKKMQEINETRHLFEELHQGKLAANSDHWPFACKGVPCILFENESGDFFQYYHTPEDNWEHCTTKTYESIFRLLTEFIDAKKTTTLSVTVNEYVELMEIVARLAGNSIYTDNQAPAYQTDVEKWFGKFSDHPCIKAMQSMKERYGTTYNAIPLLGINIEIKDGSFRLLSPKAASERWPAKASKQFLPLLTSFYHDTDFHTFFEEHKAVYGKATESFNRYVLGNFDLDWFKKNFDNVQDDNFEIILGLNQGFGNFGIERRPSASQMQHIAVMLYAADWQNNPCYNQMPHLETTIVHEFCHSFIKAKPDVKAKATALLDEHREALNKVGYGTWQEVYEETYVRASTIRYMIDHGYPEDVIKKEIESQHSYYGFVWMPLDIDFYKGDFMNRIF